MLLEMSRVLLWSPARAADLKIVWNFRKMWGRNRQVETCYLEVEQYNWGAEAHGLESNP